MVKSSLKTGALCFLCIFIAACGYRFSGSGNLPAGIKSVFISMFENRSSEIGIASVFTNDLINEFILKRKDELSNTKERADGILTGVIKSISERGISQTGFGTSIEREMTVTVAIRVTNQEGQTLWMDNNIIAREVFEVGSNKQDTEQNKKDALVELSKRLGERIHNRLIENF